MQREQCSKHGRKPQLRWLTQLLCELAHRLELDLGPAPITETYECENAFLVALDSGLHFAGGESRLHQLARQLEALVRLVRCEEAPLDATVERESDERWVANPASDAERSTAE